MKYLVIAADAGSLIGLSIEKDYWDAQTEGNDMVELNWGNGCYIVVELDEFLEKLKEALKNES